MTVKENICLRQKHFIWAIGLFVNVAEKYRVSLKKATFVIFCLISVLEVGFYFFTCVSESEF